MAEPRRVLILGAGRVSRPLIEDLLAREELRLTVASLEMDAVEDLLRDHPRAELWELDIQDESRLDRLVGNADIVVSLLPFVFHATVARHAVSHRIDMVTTSYVSPEMAALDQEARARDVLLLNEVGLDPGLDHMSAMEEIERIEAGGCRVAGFFSACGGLPSPGSNDNPWGFKFSWSPRGVLVAGRAAAHYLEDGRTIDVPADRLVEHCRTFEIDGVGRLEVYPNRDSLRYIEPYGLDGVESMFRGTLRYPGWCRTVRALNTLGLLDDTPRRIAAGTSWADLIVEHAPGTGTMRERVARRLGLPPDDQLLDRLEWAGLWSAEPVGDGVAAPIDRTARRLAERMRFGPGERDMIVLRHEFKVACPDGKRETWISQLTDYGEPGGDSAMARTVSLPAAAATRLLLDRRPPYRGVRGPLHREIYHPVLEELERIGLHFERRRPTG